VLKRGWDLYHPRYPGGERLQEILEALKRGWDLYRPRYPGGERFQEILEALKGD